MESSLELSGLWTVPLDPVYLEGDTILGSLLFRSCAVILLGIDDDWKDVGLFAVVGDE